MARSWIAAAALSLAFAGGAAEAQYGGWRVIGYKTVALGTDVDWIYTPGQWRAGQLRVCAVNAPINLRDLDVYFANGNKQDFDFAGWVGAGSCTRVLSLSGNNRRNIARVRLKYERIARSMQAPLVRIQVR